MKAPKMPREDLTGRRFNRLLVLSVYDPTRPISANNDQWWCLCDCANGDEKNKFPVYRCRLLKGSTQSCGCLSRQRLSEQRTKHGMSPSDKNNWHPLYSIWLGIKGRCYNPNLYGYSEYGGRGITMCDRWKNDFTAFMDDMYPTFKKGLTLDRRTPNHNYCPEDCKWATPKEQANNRRDNVLITIDGETKTKMQWCEKFGIKFATVCSRMRMGWTAEEALKTAPSIRAVPRKLGDISFNGKTQSVIKWATEIGIKPNTIYQRILGMGWTVERALTEKVQFKSPYNKEVE